MRTVLAALAAFMLVAAPAAAQVDTTPTIATDGRGTATLTPDLADFTAGVSRLAPTSAGARRSANARIAAVRRVVRAAGVADADVRTVGLSVSRQRVRRRVRYQAEQTLVVRVRAVAGLGALLDAVATAGADEVGDPDFGFADPSVGRVLATRAALADARRRAEDAAAQAGLRITGVRLVDLDPNLESIGGDSGGSNDSASASPASGSAETEVSAGTQEFVETVRVVYTAAPV